MCLTLPAIEQGAGPEKRCLLLLTSLMTIWLFAGAPASAEVDSVASVSVTSWDFGYMPQKSEVGHIFYLYNNSSTPLTVTKIKSGCSCTSVASIEEPIEPGDSAAVSVVFKSGRYLSRVIKTTKIYTDNPSTPEFHFRILADVIKPGEPAGKIEITPARLTWDVNDANAEVVPDTLEVFNGENHHVYISVIHAPYTTIDTLQLPPSIAPGEKAVIVINRSRDRIVDVTKGLAATLMFTGIDTTIVTLPIKIKQ